MKTKLAIAAVLFAVAVLATGAVVIASSGDAPIVPPGRTRMGDGKLPATGCRLLSHHFLGLYVKRRQAGKTPPDRTVSSLGTSDLTFWVGEPKPVLEGAYTVIKEFDESDELIGTRTIYP